MLKILGKTPSSAKKVSPMWKICVFGILFLVLHKLYCKKKGVFMSLMQIQVKLEPVFDKDKRTGYYMAFFKRFPQATGTGKTQQEAFNNLTSIFSIMLKEREDEIKEEIVRAHFNSLEINHLDLLPA